VNSCITIYAFRSEKKQTLNCSLCRYLLLFFVAPCDTAAGGVMFVHLSVCLYVTNLVNYKQMNQLCCKLAQMVYGTRRWSSQLRRSGGQRSRSQETEVRFRGLVEASVSTLLSWVELSGFSSLLYVLVAYWYTFFS